MARMLVVSGCSAVGKTTFAKQFALVNEFRYLSADNFYAAINGDERIHENKFEVWMTLYRAIYLAQQQNIDIVVDANMLTNVDRDQLLGWFPRFEHHLVFIHASPELRKVNNMTRSRQVPSTAMEYMTRHVQEPIWKDLDKRWRSYMRINNENNNFLIVEKQGEIFYE